MRKKIEDCLFDSVQFYSVIFQLFVSLNIQSFFYFFSHFLFTSFMVHSLSISFSSSFCFNYFCKQFQSQVSFLQFLVLVISFQSSELVISTPLRINIFHLLVFSNPKDRHPCLGYQSLFFFSISCFSTCPQLFSFQSCSYFCKSFLLCFSSSSDVMSCTCPQLFSFVSLQQLISHVQSQCGLQLVMFCHFSISVLVIVQIVVTSSVRL